MLAYFFQRTLPPVFQAEAQFQHFPFTAAQGAQHLIQLFTQQREGSGICRSRGIVVFDEVAQMGIFFFADRRFQGNRFLGNLHDFPYPVFRGFHQFRDFPWSRFPSQFLQQLP